MRRSSWTVCFVTICLVLVGCSTSRLQSKVVGLWANSIDDANAWEFKADGTLLLVTVEMGKEKALDRGTYEIIDDETIELKWTRIGTSRLKIKLTDDDTMVMTLPDGTQRVFKRGKRPGNVAPAG